MLLTCLSLQQPAVVHLKVAGWVGGREVCEEGEVGEVEEEEVEEEVQEDGEEEDEDEEKMGEEERGEARRRYLTSFPLLMGVKAMCGKIWTQALTTASTLHFTAHILTLETSTLSPPWTVPSHLCSCSPPGRDHSHLYSHIPPGGHHR